MFRGEPMKKITAVAAAMVAGLAASACTTTEKVNVMMPGDQAMTCAQLKAEFARLDAVKADANSDKGVRSASRQTSTLR